MKKIISFLMVIVLCLSTITLSSCDVMSHELENQVKTDIYDIYEELKVLTAESEDEEDFIEAVKEYCSENEIKDIERSDLAVVLEKEKTADEYDNKNIVYVECDMDNREETCQLISIVMSAYKNVEENGFFRVIIAPKNNLSKLDEEYLKGDNFVDVVDIAKTVLYDGSAGTKVYEMTKDVTKKAPEGQVAFKIKISGLNEGDSGDRSEKHSNPIVVIGDFLSASRSAGIHVEMASFESDGKVNEYPTEAEAVVVIEKGSKTKFENRLLNAEESFKEKNKERAPEAVFEFENVELPKKVLDYDDTSCLLSLTYTLVDGIFATTEEDYEGDVLGICTLANVEIEDDEIVLKSIGRYIDEETSKEMDNTFKMTCELSDFTVDIEDRYDVWMVDNNNPLVKSNVFKDGFEERDLEVKVRSSFVETGCSIVNNINKNMNMIILGTNINDSVISALTLIDFLKYSV
ncbi:MAG: hypothetical protein U0K95_01095 [Eubacterium sp.]|nr:hypothetical protein [Eubacterium sp.]